MEKLYEELVRCIIIYSGVEVLKSMPYSARPVYSTHERIRHSENKMLRNLSCLKARFKLLGYKLSTAQQLEPRIKTA